MVEQVQEAFGETMTSVVALCARYPIACANSIGLLCTIPYTRRVWGEGGVELPWPCLPGGVPRPRPLLPPRAQM